jgi:hypothetical protein
MSGITESDMGTVLEQKAADALLSYERRAKIRSDTLANWARYQAAAKMGAQVWSPTMTPEQRAQLEKNIADGVLPF